jgi:hypothetical protein
MRKSILFLLSFLFSILVFHNGNAQSIDLPEVRANEKDPFPKPVDGQIAEINPPGFVWLPMKNVESYRLQIINATTGDVVLEVDNIKDNVFAPRKVLPTGEFNWTVEAFDINGNIMAKRKPYRFTISEGLFEQPYPDIEKLVSSIPDSHPRLIFMHNKLPQFKATLSTTRNDAWQRLKATADSCLDLPAPELPAYDRYDEEKEYTLRRLHYQDYYRKLRVAIDRALQSLSLAWLMTHDQKYATAAKRILLEVATWDPHGISSVQHSGFDEVGLSLARGTHRAYDWLYDALTEEERAIVLANCIERARDTFERVAINRPFHRRPGSSHDGRLIAYLGEQTIVLADEAPQEEVERWLDYSLTAFMTVFPHWGGCDGGWAEGMDYGPRYNMFYTPWVEALRAVSDIDLWQRPFFTKVRNFFISCTRPNAERKPFGDGAEIGLLIPSRHTTGLAAFLNLHAERFNDPVCQWWADQLPLPTTYEFYPIVPLIPEKKQDVPLPARKEMAAYFSGVGWCAMHSDFSDLENDVFLLFKSSPFASVSHSHADQNAFHISVGGRALAIASGYYGPVYGMPHHADWTRATKANNAILVDGKGQVIRDFTAKGEITVFKNGNIITYVCGDAAPSYKGLLTRYDRHILFVRPNLFIMLDDLEAPEESTFQWLIHALEKIEVDEKNQRLISRRKGAWLDIRLFNSTDSPLSFSLTDQFDAPYYEGVPQIYKDKMTDYWHETYKKDIINQWHFTASTTEPKKQSRIVAIMLAGSEEKQPTIEWLTDGGWKGARIKTTKGIAEVWGQFTAGVAIPEALSNLSPQMSKDVLVLGLWAPNDGSPKEILFGTQGAGKN